MRPPAPHSRRRVAGAVPCRHLARRRAPAGRAHTYSVGITGSPRDSCVADSGSPARAATCRSRTPLQRLAGDDLAALDQLHQQLPVRQARRHRPRSRSPRPRRPRARPAGAPPTCGRRWTSSRPVDFFATGTSGAVRVRRLAPGPPACRPSSRSGARLPVTSWVPTPYASTGAAASEAIAYSSRSEVTTIFVSVAPSSSSCCRTRCATSSRSPGVDAHGAQLGPGDLHGRAHGLGDVVRVDQQRRAPAQRVHLGLEGVPLGVVQQGEGVRAGADRRDAVAEARPPGRRWRRSRRRTRPARRPRRPARGCAGRPSRSAGAARRRRTSGRRRPRSPSRG